MAQQLATRQETPLGSFRVQMDKMAGEFSKVLPPHMTPDRLVRTVISSVQTNPKLLQADRTSLLSAVMTSAVLGLEPDGVTGQGYLVPFKGKVQFLPGYKGYITLAMNSGFILDGHVVYENDTFSYQLGTEPMIKHVPAALDRKSPGNIAFAYATARSNTTPTIAKVMTLDELMAVRDASSGYKAMGRNSPWSTDFPAMCRKTVIRRLGGSLPLNVQRLAAIEAAADEGQVASMDTEGEIIIEGDVEDATVQ